MVSGLIGYTGFVGSNLDRAGNFEARYNSANFRQIAGGSFDLLICAGVSAAKWMANAEPEEDKRKIAKLTDALGTARVREFILISTIDVYPDLANGADEGSPIDPAANHAYGRHRYELEQWAVATFPSCRIVRLPALFGTGLRKNALYDLIHDHQISSINPAAIYQWYPIGRLWSDITVMRSQDVSLVNLCGEPLRLSVVIDRFFPNSSVGLPTSPAPEYRIVTRHAAAFGGSGKYVLSAEQTLEGIGAFIQSQVCHR